MNGSKMKTALLSFCLKDAKHSRIPQCNKNACRILFLGVTVFQNILTGRQLFMILFSTKCANAECIFSIRLVLQGIAILLLWIIIISLSHVVHQWMKWSVTEFLTGGHYRREISLMVRAMRINFLFLINTFYFPVKPFSEVKFI